MKISIVLPTHRTTNSALARVLELSTLDARKFEFIVRDNSANDAKKAILQSLSTDCMKLHFVPERGAYENAIESIRLATGDFVFLVGDDDWVSIQALYQLHSLAEQIGDDVSVGGLTGTYLVEAAQGSGTLAYSELDSPDASRRVAKYLSVNGPNLLVYLAVRRDLVNFAFGLAHSLPFRLSYHDWLISLIYLVSGRICPINRVLFTYNLGEWETLEKGLSKDELFYTRAGLPPEFNRIHWLLCAMEGGLLLRSRLLSSHASYDAATLINIWRASNLNRFRAQARDTGSSENEVGRLAAGIRDKWRAETEISLDEVLLDVTNLLDVVNPDRARQYFDYWSDL